MALRKGDRFQLCQVPFRQHSDLGEAYTSGSILGERTPPLDWKRNMI
jgi:hypothetical protein